MKFSALGLAVLSTLMLVQSSQADDTIIRGTDTDVAAGLNSVNGLAGTENLQNPSIVVCPPESFVSAIQGVQQPEFGSLPLAKIRYVCKDASGKQTAIRGTDGSVIGNNLPSGYKGTTPLDNANSVVCPPGSFASGIQSFKPNGSPQDVVQLRYSCKTTIGGQTGIRGTDPIMLAPGPFPGLAGSIALTETKTVACPRFTFINGIQAFKPNGQTDIVKFRYSCKALAAFPGSATPKYLVLLVAYAPPGTAGGKGDSQSSVEYGSESSAGTTTSVSQTFKSGFSSSFDAEIIGNGGGQSFSSSTSVTDSSAVDIKKTSTNDIKIPGPAQNGIDHNRDRIYLWLSPQISLSLTSASALWSFTGTGTALVQYVEAGWISDICLKKQSGPNCMPEAVQQTLKQAGLTNADFKEIRTHDVLLNNGKLDANRFMPLNSTFPYEPPSSASEPVPSSKFTQTSSTSSTTGTKTTDDYKVATNFSGGADFAKIVKVAMKSADTWEWTNESSQSQSSGSTQSASVTIGAPSFGYKGPTMMGVYYDSIYGTFAFVPISVPPSALHGAVLDKDQKPVPNAPVVLKAGSKSYRTITNARGEWTLPQKINGACAVQTGEATAKTIPNCAKAGAIKLTQ
jgi:hypothetical protein